MYTYMYLFCAVVFFFLKPVYPYSALWIEAASYCDTSTMTYQTTRCHKTEFQNVNTHCIQSPQSYTIWLMYRVSLFTVHCFVVLENNYCWNVLMQLIKRGSQKIKKIVKPSATLPKGLWSETKLMYKHINKTFTANFIFANVYWNFLLNSRYADTQRHIRWHHSTQRNPL
jgi:hypothetical protein